MKVRYQPIWLLTQSPLKILHLLLLARTQVKPIVVQHLTYKNSKKHWSLRHTRYIKLFFWCFLKQGGHSEQSQLSSLDGLVVYCFTALVPYAHACEHMHTYSHTPSSNFNLSTNVCMSLTILGYILQLEERGSVPCSPTGREKDSDPGKKHGWLFASFPSPLYQKNSRWQQSIVGTEGLWGECPVLWAAWFP